MSINLLALYGVQYATAVQLLLQQKGSLFRPFVTEKGDYTGKIASPVDQMGAVEMQPVLSTFQPIGRVDAPFDRRWVSPSPFDLPQMADTFDKLKVLSDPAGSYTMNAVNGANRKIDDVIIGAMHGNALTGTDGTTPTGLPAGQSVSVNTGGAASGLNVDKIKRAKRILKAAQVAPDDPMNIAITAQDEEALLGDVQVINEQYNNAIKPKFDDNGNLQRILGVNVIQSERILTGTDDASGTSRALPMWVKSGMHLGLWSDVRADITQRKDIAGLPYQVYLYMMIGATRLEEKKMTRIWAR